MRAILRKPTLSEKVYRLMESDFDDTFPKVRKDELKKMFDDNEYYILNKGDYVVVSSDERVLQEVSRRLG